MNAVVVIPALNPAERLVGYVDALHDIGFDDIVVVDDGSGESSHSIFDAISTRAFCRVLRHDVNCGKGAALKTGFAYAMEHCPQRRILLTADADGQHLPEDCRKVAEALAGDDDVLVLGSRDFTAPDVPFRSWLGNRTTSVVFKLLHGRSLPDTQTGLRAFSMSLVPRMLAVPGDRFEYETAVLVALAKAGVPFRITRISTIYEDGNSCSHFSPVADSIRIYRIIAGSFLRFAFVSFTSFLLDQGLAWLFADVVLAGLGVSASSGIWISGFVARLLSSAYNYLLNRSYVFKAGDRMADSAWRYVLLCIGVICMSNLGVHVLHWLGVQRGLAKVVCDIVLFFICYGMQSRWVFKKSGKCKAKEVTSCVHQ